MGKGMRALSWFGVSTRPNRGSLSRLSGVGRNASPNHGTWAAHGCVPSILPSDNNHFLGGTGGTGGTAERKQAVRGGTGRWDRMVPAGLGINVGTTLYPGQYHLAWRFPLRVPPVPRQARRVFR